MTLLVVQREGIPLPVPTVLSEPYWDGCAHGEVRFQRCAACRATNHPPTMLCGQCWARQLSWEVSRGTGFVYSWTVVWRPQTAAFTVPYAPVIVDMDEGFQLLSCVVGCDDSDIHVGMAVEMVFHEVGGVALPYATPSGQPARGLDQASEPICE